MTVKPFNATFFMLLAIGAILFITISAVFKKQSVKSKKVFLVVMSVANIALYFTYKACLSVDAEFVAISGISKFNWFNELPLQLCNINLFLIPIGALIGSRAIMGFSFFTAPLGAVMALIFPEPAFTGFSLATPRIFGFYVTHILIMVAGLTLTSLGFYRPQFKDFPRVVVAFLALSFSVHIINLILRATVCPFANYFFTFGADVSILKLFWRFIPVPYLFELPSIAILLAYMFVVTSAMNTADRLKARRAAVSASSENV